MKKARHYYEEAIELRADVADVRCNLGLNYLRVDERNMANHHLQLLESLDSESADQLKHAIWGRFVVDVSAFGTNKQ